MAREAVATATTIAALVIRLRKGQQRFCQFFCRLFGRLHIHFLLLLAYYVYVITHIRKNYGRHTLMDGIGHAIFPADVV